MNTRPANDTKEQSITFDDDNQLDTSDLSSSPTRRWRNCTLQRRGSRASTLSEDFGERYRSRSRGSLVGQLNPDMSENQWHNKVEQTTNRSNSSYDLNDRSREDESDNMTSLHDQTIPNPIAEAWRKYFRKEIR
ncbi:hypothetical protein SPOG_03232 [Schizosaccharomyces cryophilus OY26]|uniref:Uncharacterized protein n=1 Tax=Schizosaccharomyces cryophilus (strain OY26 / ATCC MYA-4695 / CBS 11777 / NBRC 106824 / NRRL Y48691) TaxID=653667 RepID=S9X7J9_SCHCR|nr:uncharacterized protein SPOG_03232 [Schizosaccharomyces cryophilus OY26]EPY49756.1 hypothetical protein SPOG_03232 [Schizosaccharomyces cryophilus OY26]